MHNHPNTTEPENRQHAERIATVTVNSASQRKKFHLDLMENNRGRFVKFKEIGDSGRSNTCLIPIESLGDIVQAFQEIAEANKRNS